LYAVFYHNPVYVPWRPKAGPAGAANTQPSRPRITIKAREKSIVFDANDSRPAIEVPANGDACQPIKSEDKAA